MGEPLGRVNQELYESRKALEAEFDALLIAAGVSLETSQTDSRLAIPSGGSEACKSAWKRWTGWKPHDMAAPGVNATPGEHFRAGWDAALAFQASNGMPIAHPRHPCPPDGLCMIGDDEVCVTCGTCFATSCESANACPECIERCRRRHQIETWFEQAGAKTNVEPNNRDAMTGTMLAYSPEPSSIPAAKDIPPADGSNEPGVSSWLVTPARIAALADAFASEWDGRTGHGDRDVVRDMLAEARGAEVSVAIATDTVAQMSRD